MSPGIYHIEPERDGAPISPFKFALEPFSLPEALQAGQNCIAHRQYTRAAAVLSDAVERYPTNADAQDLLVLANALPAVGPSACQDERSEFEVTRSAGDLARRLPELLASAKGMFGKAMASVFAARSLNRAAIPDEVFAKMAQETASTLVLQVMGALRQQLATREDVLKDQLLLQLVDSVTQRLEEVDVLRRELSDRIDLLRQDAVKGVDERFREIEGALERFGEELARRNLRTPDYEAFFADKLGRPCWQWVSRDARRIFIESEDHYRHAEARPGADQPDFTAGLLDLCRGLELLLNEKLGAMCGRISGVVLGDAQAMIDAGRALPERLRDKLRPNLEKSLDKTEKRKNLSPSEIAFVLQSERSRKACSAVTPEPSFFAPPGPRTLISSRSSTSSRRSIGMGRRIPCRVQPISSPPATTCER